ncbi:unnamed protein product, partial [Effrenium voratum]
AVPSDVRLDIHRAAEEHQVLQQRRLAEQQDRGARTGTDVLQAQMREIESLLEGQESSIEGALPGEDLRSTHMGIRSYIGRRLHAALGEALFECQRFKSKGNKALATPQDEIAFIAMCPLACPSSPNKRFHVSGDQVPPEKNGGGTGG